MPAVASWLHRDVRSGFEVLFVETSPGRISLRGTTTAVEGNSTWAVGYVVDLDEHWNTQGVVATNATVRGEARRAIQRLGAGRWAIDGVHDPALDGCSDVDFESSSVTNAIPIHRMAFDVGETVEAPAAFVRADDLSVVRIEQQYTLVGIGDREITFDYISVTFGFACRLTFDASGLILDYQVSRFVTASGRYRQPGRG
nr:putative glycolipid-binding domain-containing protein [Cryobacterium roopkundense]